MKKENIMQMKHPSFGTTRLIKAYYVWSMIFVVMVVLLGGAVNAQQSSSDSAKGGNSDQAYSHPEHGSLDEIGAKISNPTSNVWSLVTEFDLSFSDGDLNRGSAKLGGRMIFQPAMPIPLYGEGKEAWKLITRPTIPILFSEPVPNRLGEFSNKGGLGDILLPVMLNPPAGNWILALGPTFLFPSATETAFGRQQWGLGPAGVLGYATKKWIAFVFPQYWWGIGGAGQDKNTPDASFLSLFYGFFYNLGNGWQIGTNPTISYDNTASSGNKWNVPVGITVAKMTTILGHPVKFQLGFEYSVVGQDTFGQVAQIKLSIIPVISSLIKNPIFGGK
jgi:hypothetical protein